MTENVGAMFYGVKDVKVEKLSTQQVGDDDIMVAMRTVGICGTDMHYYLDGGIPGLGMIEQPWVIGHEGSGTIIKMGSNVNDLNIGDQVVLDPNANCQFCHYCVNNKDNLCTDAARYYLDPYRGFFEKFHVHSCKYAYRLPANMAADEAAVIEPVSCALHAIQRGGVKYGHSVLICGAGPIGLVHLLVAKVYGAQKVFMTDIDAERLAFAKELGATQVVKVERGSDPKTLGDQIYSDIGDGADITFDCSGVQFSLQLAAYATKTGGKLVLTGLSGSHSSEIPVNIFTCKEIDILGIIRYRSSCFREAISLVSSRKVDVRSLVSHKFPLTEAVKALETVASRNTRVIKVLIDCAK